MEKLNKKPWVAVLLSFILTGAGHAYLRHWWNFIGLLIFQIGMTLFGMPYFIPILAMIFAYTDTIKYNKQIK